MHRIRNAVIRCVRLAGPLLGMALIVCIGGLSIHAAGDWHRHGELGVSFFHLHFHVGEHEHDHPADDDHHHNNTPTHGKRKRSAVLTVAQALVNASEGAPVVASPDLSPDRKPNELVVLSWSTETRAFARPRAPPV